MWFKSVSAYRLPVDFAFERDSFNAGLEKAVLTPIGPLEPSRKGFVSPFGNDSEVLMHESSECALLELGGRERVLPSSVVKEAMEAKLKAIRERTGRNPGKKQREQIKDEVMLDLLPRAFVKPSRQAAYIDLHSKMLIVDAATDKPAEAIITQLREGLGSFVAEPVQTEESVSAMLSAWLIAGKCDGPFELGDECELKDPVDTGCAIKAKRHDLSVEEIREHVRTGKKVSQLGLIYDNRLSFVLDEKFKLRKIKFLDIILDEIKDTAGENPAVELDTRFTLMALEFRRLLVSLDELFKLM
jgi:recombination associated protein RdgC